MSTIGTVLTVIVALLSVILIIIILMQSKRSAGLGAISASSSADSYWSKNKGNSMEGALERYTKIGAFLFMAITFAINLIG